MSAERRRIAELERALEVAGRYEEWLALASELDTLDGGAEWRADDASPHYDPQALRATLAELTRLRHAGAPLVLADHLHTSLHRHVAEITDPALYAVSVVGTKRLIEAYLDAVVEALDYLATAPLPGVSDAQRLALFDREAHNVGRPALMLSGGATLGLFHIGVVKALWESHLLPSVVSGASTGSMIAGALCTRSDDELAEIFADPGSRIDTRVFRLLGPSDMRERRVVMSQEQLHHAIRANMADDTFAEAYARTGRTLCITVSPTRARQKPRLLSASTSPDVLVTSASLASCAIPGMFPPSTLLQRRGGLVGEYVPGERWIDGTVQTDLPMARLARLLNVNYTIVSQTNAHVLPLANARNARGLVPAVTDLVSSSLHAQSLQVLAVARRHAPTAWLRRTLERVHGVADQRAVGDITVAPPMSLWNYGIILRNATPDDLRRLITQGERATWPRLHVIRAQTRVSRALERCVAKLSGR